MLCGENEWEVGEILAFVEWEGHRYLKCGTLAHAIARARCPKCGHDF
jgi:hypothetical protein